MTLKASMLTTTQQTDPDLLLQELCEVLLPVYKHSDELVGTAPHWRRHSWMGRQNDLVLQASYCIFSQMSKYINHYSTCCIAICSTGQYFCSAYYIISKFILSSHVIVSCPAPRGKVGLAPRIFKVGLALHHITSPNG